MTILLTSGSIERKDLLQQLGFHELVDFVLVEVPVDFQYHNQGKKLTLPEVKEKVIAAARLKIRRAEELQLLPALGLPLEESVLVGAATVLFHDGQVMERREATSKAVKEMLMTFRGQELTILTGLVVAQGDKLSNQRSACGVTRIKMKQYDDGDIEAYVASEEELDLAGGVDLQGQGVVLCEKIKGSFSNVGGLPLVVLVQLLRDPLFADRIQFRLSDPDQGKYSMALEEGRQRLKVVSVGELPHDLNEAGPDIEGAHVLHVLGRHLIDPGQQAANLLAMESARRAGILIVLDNNAAVEKALDRHAFLELVNNRVDVLLAEEVTNPHLSQLMAPRLLLASQSPRRRELLKQIVAGNMIEVLASQHDEPYLTEKAEMRVKRLALEKAKAVLAQEQAFSSTIKIVIGADTEVVLDGEALGKPAGKEEARQQLRRLQGRAHQVITGIALISTETGREFVDIVSTRVTFKQLSEVEIETYISSGEPKGKAGAYGIQSKGALFVEEIDGSYSNVVGLPLERLSEILDREFGMPVWQFGAVYGPRFVP